MRNRCAPCRFASAVVFIILVACAASVSGLTGCGKLSSGNKQTGSAAQGGEFIENMRANIRSSITDTDRAADMIAILDRMERDKTELDGVVSEFYATFDTLDNSYDTTRDEFEAVFAEFEETIVTYRRRFLGSLLQIESRATPEERAKLSVLDKTLYETWRRKYAT